MAFDLNLREKNATLQRKGVTNPVALAAQDKAKCFHAKLGAAQMFSAIWTCFTMLGNVVYANGFECVIVTMRGCSPSGCERQG